MEYFALKKHTDQSILFEGYFRSFIECLEKAISKTINLSHIDLKFKNLSNANLDDAFMPYANFKGANLTGVNLSESVISNATFVNAALFNTCYSYSNISNCDFRGALFGATLIEGCNIDEAKFSTLSSFDLDFQNVKSMKDCMFQDKNGIKHKVSKTPIIFKGLLHQPVIVLDHTIAIGTKTLPKNLLPDLLSAVFPINDQPIKVKG